MIKRLIWFGAVYSCRVVPLPPAQSSGGVGSETQARIRAWHEAGIKKFGKNVRAGGLLPLSSP